MISEPVKQTGFLAEFYVIGADQRDIRSLAEIDFDAPPTHQQVVEKLNYSGDDPFWDGGPGNFFAARFSATITVQTAGTYTFFLNSDDGSQMSLGGDVVIDNDGLHSAKLQTVTLDLDAGSHPIEVLYFEARGTQTLDLEWSGPDTAFQTVSLDNVTQPGSDIVAPEPAEPKPAEPKPVDPEPVDPEPAEPQPVDPEPVVPPSEPERPVTGSNDGPQRIEAVDYTAGHTLSVDGGRTTTIQLDTAKTIASVEITEGPAVGNATVNPDGSIALVLTGSDYDGALSVGYKVTYADGSSATEVMELSVAPVTQAAGWGMGEHYMLETDAAGDVIVETGDNHRKVFVSESKEALSLADIAAREGIPVENIDGQWLLANGEYGASEGMALASDAGMALWYELTIGKEAEPGSHWLLFESGYEYSDLGKVVGRGASGESELHPLHVTSWGEGPAPVLNNSVSISQLPSQNVVISNLSVTGGMGVKGATNVLVTDTEFTEVIMNVRNSEGFTLHDSSISHTTVQTDDGSGVTQGFLGVASTGILMEGNVFHHNGWEEGYGMDGTGGAPDMYSHNVYLQWDTRDVTYRDNISSQGASFGAQLRGGAFAEDNVFLDNNVAVNFLGGNYKDFGNVGNFTYFANNLVTSGSYKDAQGIGGKGWGTINGGADTTLLDNIVAHLANPDDPSDLEDKQITRFATTQHDGGSYLYEDTMVLNWLAADPRRYKDEALDRNLEDVDFDTAMQTTIQRYADQLTGGATATIGGLMEYILTLAETEFDDTVTASDIVNYFRSGFGVDPTDTTGDTAHRFIPNDLADGIRWDNSINWDSGELPTDGDVVDLAGNWVNYGVLTTRIEDLDLGAGGKLSITSGLLGVEDTLETGGGTGRISLDGAGQFWTDGYSAAGLLEADVAGGRFANTGVMDGDLAIRVSDNGQAILATDGGLMTLSGQSELRIEGSDVRVGFDGDSNGTAILQMDEGAVLSFIADAEGFSTLGEFRSGAWDQSGSPVQSGISLDGVLAIDLSAYQGGVGTHKLIEVDALHNMFDEFIFHGLEDGLQAQVVIDFDTDQLVLEITAGNDAAELEIIGNPYARGDETSALWSDVTAGQGGYDGSLPELSQYPGSEFDLLF